MRRMIIVGMLGALSFECHAQGMTPSADQCGQVRSAVAQYGLQAARKYAFENYGLTPVDLRAIEQTCGIGGNRVQKDNTASRRRD